MFDELVHRRDEDPGSCTRDLERMVERESTVTFTHVLKPIELFLCRSFIYGQMGSKSVDLNNTQ